MSENKEFMEELLSGEPLDSEDALKSLDNNMVESESLFADPLFQVVDSEGNSLNEMKAAAGKPVLEGLKAIDPELVKAALTERFLACFYEGCKCDDLRAFVEEMAK